MPALQVWNQARAAIADCICRWASLTSGVGGVEGVGGRGACEAGLIVLLDLPYTAGPHCD